MHNNGISSEKTNHIVPEAAATDGGKIIIYETHDDGTITKLEHYKNLPSDNNYLNNAMIKSNEDFSALLEIEDE